uniref:Conserved plasma membrane protein n=1 Tax=Rhabditophanes sp. KR3021 TaxID=114890 RepID=A0AC35TPT6_9BILA
MDPPKITAQPVTCQILKLCTATNATPKTMKIAAIALTSFALGYVAYRYYIGGCLCGPDTETLKRVPPKQPSSSRIQPPADGAPLTGSADVSFEIIPSSNVSTAQGTDGATRFHFDKTLVLADELKSSISRLNEVAKEPVEDENNAVSYDTVAEAVRGMFEDIKLVSNETVPAEKYQVTCPVGCQADADVFFVLSMVSIGFTVLLALTYLIITFIRDYKDAEASKLLDPRATLLKKPKKSKKKESSNNILEAKECEQDFCVILHGVIKFGNDSFHGSFVGCKNEFEEMMDANNFMQWQHYLDDMNTCSSPNGFHLLFANNDDGYLGAFTFKCTRKGEDIHKIKAYHAKRGNVEIGRKSGFRNGK